MKDYYTADEIAEKLRVTRRTVYSYIKAGKLKGQKLEGGRKWLITPADFDAFTTPKK